MISDPNFDVVDVKADASVRGNLMLIAVTAIRKEDQKKFTSITLLTGAECFVREDIVVGS